MLKLRRLMVGAAMLASVAGAHAEAAQVRLTWNPVPCETQAPPCEVYTYRLYMRYPGQQYGSPIWSGPETTVAVDLPADTRAHFVVRAYGRSTTGNETTFATPQTTETITWVPKEGSGVVDRWQLFARYTGQAYVWEAPACDVPAAVTSCVITVVPGNVWLVMRNIGESINSNEATYIPVKGPSNLRLEW